MKILQSKLHGQILSQLELVDGSEYLIGRADSCDLCLDKLKGISRQHVKVLQNEDNIWVAQVISRFGKLHYNDGVAREIVLDKTLSFHILSYEIEFIINPPEDKELKDSKEAQDLQTPQESSISEDFGNSKEAPQEDSESPPTFPLTTHHDDNANEEVTAAGMSKLVPHLDILWTDQPTESIPLEGDRWIVGRDNSADITIPKKTVSRKQFLIQRKDEDFHISDLGSFNGTHLNEKPLNYGEPQPLHSQDIISVKKIKIRFLIKNESLEDASISDSLNNSLVLINNDNLLNENLPIESKAPILHGNQPTEYNDFNGNPINEDSPNVIRISSNELKDQNHTHSKKKIILALAALGIIFIYYATDNSTPSHSPPKEETSTSQGVEDDIKQFPKEQQMIIRDTFNLARKHYTQAEYDLCLSEIKKLHQQVAFYKNSKEIEGLCEQGKILTLKKMEQARREQAAKETQMKIEALIQKCKRQINEQTTITQLESCLSDARERDPNNPDITRLITQIKDRNAKRAQNRARQSQYRSRVQQGKQKYESAKKIYASGNLASAIEAYQEYINTALPDPNKLKPRAQRELASIKVEFKEKVNQRLDKCKESIKSSNYKQAIQSCDAVLSEDPSNKNAESLRGAAINLLRKKMKQIYDDSVLEEQFGNIQAAREKWNKILIESTPDEDYFKRAKRKLKKYDMGFDKNEDR